MKATILTAYNQAFARIGGICAHSIRTYASAQGHKWAVENIPEDYPRPASWAKVNLIRKHLKETDVVQWIDADALIIGTASLKTILDPVTLNIAKDHNGINCGVMAWRNDPKAHDLLAEIEDRYEAHKESAWFEQAALMEILAQTTSRGEFETLGEQKDIVHYQPKHLFNAYPGEETEDTLILHFPGMPDAESRIIPMMEAALAHKL